jgi:hypothetical protein
MSRKKPIPEDILKLADEYCRAQLEIVDGTAENGIKRIGTERFETLIRQVAKTLAELRL